MLEGQLYWVHHGGQKNKQGLLSNNISLAAGVGYSVYPRKKRMVKFVDEIGAAIHFLYNYDNPIGKNNPKQKSYGVLGKLFIKLRGAEIYYQHWTTKNNDFSPEKGDPLYQAKNYGEVGLEKIFAIGDGIDCSWRFPFKAANCSVDTSVFVIKPSINYLFGRETRNPHCFILDVTRQ